MKNLSLLAAFLILSFSSFAQNNEGVFTINQFHEGLKDSFVVHGYIKGSLMHLSIPGRQKEGNTDIFIDKEKNSICLLSTNPDSITVVFNLKDYFHMLEESYCEKPCRIYSFNQQVSKDPKSPLQHFSCLGSGESILMTVNAEGQLDMIPILRLLHVEGYIMHLPSPKGSITLLQRKGKEGNSYIRCSFSAAKVDDANFRIPKTTQIMHLENLSALKDQDKVREFFKGLTSHF
jgi:hypothetical protein